VAIFSFFFPFSAVTDMPGLADHLKMHLTQNAKLWCIEISLRLNFLKGSFLRLTSIMATCHHAATKNKS
jgi:hypothetical protein